MAPTMRIFVASGIFHPEPGGPSTYLYRLLPALQARGHTVRVLTFGEGPTQGYPYPLRRIPRYALPIRMLDYARAAWGESHRADVIFANSLGLPLIGVRQPRVLKVVGDLAWERSVNRGWIAPTTDVDQFQTQHQGWRVEALKAQRAREVRRADRVLVPSEYLRRMVTGWGAAPDRVQVIYNALPDEPAPDCSPDQARVALGLAPGPLLLTAARLVPWKGIDHLLRALAAVPDVRLLIAGDGPDEARLRALAAEVGAAARVTFLGRVPRDRLGLYLRAADYLALYSGYEGLSHTILEALHAGTPVIASDKGGNPELIAHDVNGLLVPYPDPAALSRAIRAAFEGGTRARLAANAGQGLERFVWERLVDETAELLERACTS